MPGPILHIGATVLCAHGGQAVPTVPSPRVMVSGQPIATIAAPYVVAGCAFVPPAGNGPCVTALWTVGAVLTGIVLGCLYWLLPVPALLSECLLSAILSPQIL